MRKMIDGVERVELTEFGYTNRNGDIEIIQISNSEWVTLKFIEQDQDAMNMHQIYISDLPKFILAAQAVLDEVAARAALNK